MATPPKSTPAKPGVKKVVPSVKPAAQAVPAPKAPIQGEAVKPAPFVIEPGSLSSFVDKSDSALPSTKKAVETPPPPPEPVAAKAEAAPPAPSPVAKPAAEPVKAPEKATEPEKAPEKAAEPVKVEPEAEVEKAAPVKAEAPAEKASPVESKASPSQPAVAEKMVAAIEKAAQWQAPNALEGHYIMNEAIETSKKFAEDAKSRLQTIVTDFNEKAKVAVEKSSKTAEELSDIAKGNLEALVESSKIAAKGFETLGQNAAEYGRSSFEKTSATLKSFASVKSPTEFFQLQSELFTSAFDTLASETAKNSEAVLKLAGEIVQPISNRYAVVSDKLKSLAA